MGQKARDQQTQNKSGVLEDKQQFGDERAEDKLSHMGDKPASPQHDPSQGSQKQQK